MKRYARLTSRPMLGEVDTVPRFLHNFKADSWNWRRHNENL